MSNDSISKLAYALWHARGCPEGSADIDWAEAERQVMGARRATAPIEDPLDESLQETFPASDPPASSFPDVPPSNAADKWATSTSTQNRAKKAAGGKK